MNEEGIHVSATNDKKQNAVLFRFSKGQIFPSRGISVFVGCIQSYRKGSTFGLGGFIYSDMASGRDAFMGDIMFWDIAGGIPLVLAAGGRFR